MGREWKLQWRTCCSGENGRFTDSCKYEYTDRLLFARYLATKWKYLSPFYQLCWQWIGESEMLPSVEEISDFSLGFLLSCCCCCLSLQSCSTLCNPTDCSPPGSSVHGISRQEYWNGLPFPSSGDLPDLWMIKPVSPVLAGGFFTAESPRNPYLLFSILK